MTFVDLGFPVRGPAVPRDHGYALYAALSGAVPALHGASWLGLHPLSGTPLDGDRLVLRDQARLLLRLPAERIPDALPLAGQTIEVAGARLVLGAPNVSALIPAASLDARLVVIKLTDAPHRANQELGRETLDTGAFAERYRAELVRQLAALGIMSKPELHGRRSMTVSGKRIVGYSVRVSALNADQSLALIPLRCLRALSTAGWTRTVSQARTRSRRCLRALSTPVHSTAPARRPVDPAPMPSGAEHELVTDRDVEGRAERGRSPRDQPPPCWRKRPCFTK